MDHKRRLSIPVTGGTDGVYTLETGDTSSEITMSSLIYGGGMNGGGIGTGGMRKGQ